MKKLVIFCCLALLCACARQPVLETSPENRAVLDSAGKSLRLSALPTSLNPIACN